MTNSRMMMKAKSTLKSDGDPSKGINTWDDLHIGLRDMFNGWNKRRYEDVSDMHDTKHEIPKIWANKINFKVNVLQNLVPEI